MKRIILITGGQRSGKSAYAEQLALSLDAHPIYMATAHIWDEEFRLRVSQHQRRRGEQWENIEEERQLSKHCIYNKVCVIDCLTLWYTNFFYGDGKNTAEEIDVQEVLSNLKDEFDRFTQQRATFIFVTNENLLQRKCTDLEGWMNQYVAQRADEVILMVAGIPVKIK